MRLDRALGITVCLILATQLGCSGSNEGQKPDGPPSNCASCTADEVCVQQNDGMCNQGQGIQIACLTVSDACRSKLASSGGKSCSLLPECELEFCMQPYRCIYSSPCGNEVPEAAVYCYGP